MAGIGNAPNRGSKILASAELFGPPPPPPVSLHINPNTVTLLLGQSMQCVVFDEVGRQRYDATWSVSDPNLATLSTDVPPILTATGYGQVTLIAQIDGVSAQAQITIAPSSVQVTPTTVNMQVGDVRQFTAVDNFGNPVSAAITWTVSDTNIATVSSDSSPSLTAIKVGQVTLTATVEGVASGPAQITISPAGQIAPGSVLWSVPPAPGFSPLQIAHAEPTNTGPGLYAIATNGSQSTVQALTSDGRQIWQSLQPVVNNNSIPDGNGGLIVTEHQTCYNNQTDPMTIVDLDASTGKPKWPSPIQAAGVQNGSVTVYCYLPSSTPQFAVRGDGAVIIAEPNNGGLPPLQMVDGQSGSPIIPILIPFSTITNSSGTTNVQSLMGPPMVNSDGYTYVEYQVRNADFTTSPGKVTSATVYLLRLAPDNTYSNIQLSSTTQDQSLLPGPVIPDGQGGEVATWAISPSNGQLPVHPYQGSHVISGAAGTPYDLPFSPKTVDPQKFPTLVLGENNNIFATDGTNTDSGPQVVSFDLSSGTSSWQYPGSSTQTTLSIVAATAEGGLIVNDVQAGVIKLDTNGAPSQVTGALGNTPHYSWSGQWYLESPQGASAIALPVDADKGGLWATPSGGPSQNGAAGALCECLLQDSDLAPTLPNPGSSTATAPSTLEVDLTAVPSAATPANCLICSLSPPVPPATSCVTFAGTGSAYLILVGDPGSDFHNHNAHQYFNLAAQQNANELNAQGHKVVACRVSSVQDVNNALTQNGFIDGGVIYDGHSGPYELLDATNTVTAKISILAPGQAKGADTNIGYYNVNKVCDSTQGCDPNKLLGTNAAVLLNGCRTLKHTEGLLNATDVYGTSSQPIAKLLKRQLQRGVYGYSVGTYFSNLDRFHEKKFGYLRGQDPPAQLPIYLVPEGVPFHKPDSALPEP